MSVYDSSIAPFRYTPFFVLFMLSSAPEEVKRLFSLQNANQVMM